ncbi:MULTISPECIES: hypothetical protein [Methylotenera]|uniref:hypothetical protein n=1 Tax=Methylotenera TaxID=359407 RepID=UPI000381A0AC|nr:MULTISPECIES: hypothetical protein [Methylotenera]
MNSYRLPNNLTVDLGPSKKIDHSNILDFGILPIPYGLAYGFKEAFESLQGGLTMETKKISWRHLKTFCKYLQATNQNNTLPLPSNIVVDFSNWLKTEYPSSLNYKGVILNQNLMLITWCCRNKSGLVDSDLRMDLPRLHTKKQPVHKSALNEYDIKKILSAAYLDIDETFNRIQKYRNLIFNSDDKPEDNRLAFVLNNLRQSTSSLFPKLREMPNKLKVQAVSEGGLKYLSKLLYPDSEDIFPFYLAILCQCSGNPMSMRILTLDCVKDHPLIDERKRIVWSKERSGREQKADFNIKRVRSAPNLIKQLQQLTEPLRKHTTEANKKYVFLAYKRGFIAVTSWQQLHLELKKFIDKHQLPNFVFKDLRRAGAELHQSAAQSIIAARDRLNHQSSATTAKYLNEEASKEVKDKLIADAQRNFHQAIQHQAFTTIKEIERLDLKPADTLFGFQCKNPFAGIAPGSSTETLCINFTGCATCPGSIIPLDNYKIITRLLTSLEQLKLTRKRALESGWIERYKVIYESTEKALEEIILPKVHPSVLAKAKEAISKLVVPYLE